MPRASAEKSYFRFTAGKITEASPLTFPENSMKDELNIDINFDGTIQRRRGLDFEEGYSLTSTPSISTDDVVIQTYLWEDVRNFDENTPVLVVRTGAVLSFYRAYADPVSTSKIADDIFLYPLLDSIGAEAEQVSFASGKGYLFVAGSKFDPIYVEYNKDSGEFTKEPITIKVRDLEGIDDGLRDDERPSTLSGNHMYNLVNQGWPYQRTNWKRRPQHDIAGVRISSPEAFRICSTQDFSLGVKAYPSNSDIYSDYMETETMTGSLLTSKYSRSGSAPKGKVIIDAFEENRKDLSLDYSNTGGAVSPWIDPTYEEKRTDKRPSAITFFQGHVMYAGVNDLDYGGKVYVSQSIVGPDRFGKCHSVNDPTADIESSPLATDGGVIEIGGVGRIIALESIGDQCLVIASNGVWSIGSPEGAFTVNSLALTRLSTAGAVGSSTVSSFESSVFYWSADGIYIVTRDPQLGTLTVNNAIEETIQSAYINIPVNKKPFATTLTDPADRKVYWLYSNLGSDDNVSRYNRALVFDLRSGAFFDYEFPVEEGFPYVVGGYVKPPIEEVSFPINVVSGSLNVVEGSDNVIIASTTTIDTGGDSQLKLLTVVPGSPYPEITFSDFGDRGFRDWRSFNGDGLNYESYVETGYELLGDAMRDKQATYVFCYFNRTEEEGVFEGDGIALNYPSSCKLYGKWDWTSTNTANKWSDPQQAYRFLRNYIIEQGPFDYSYDVIETKNKVRGKGKALSLRFESEENKDFQLLGWAINYTADGTP